MQFEHSALEPAGSMAMRIEHLWWLFVGISVVVYVVVLAFLVHALVRRKRERAGQEMAAAEARSRIVIGCAIATTVFVLATLAISDFMTGRVLARTPGDPLRIVLTGHQWWWEAEYVDPISSNRVRTANELHIPTGRSVLFELKSVDVIHSFWVPNLQGKRDMLPGRTNHMALIADRPGMYEGQCAEFCGFQHAKMRLGLRAELPAEFDAWKARMLQPAREPVSAQEKRGQEVFLASSCILCHAIQGTPASATNGPDLTHVASRSRIAAGALQNTADNIASWIRNPQAIKPGSQMPATALAPADLAALATYLSSLS